MKKITIITFLLLAVSLINAQKISMPPMPSAAQLAWHEQELYLFAHFGPNTYTDLEWGHGDEKAEIFNPEKLDCDQWCRVAKAAGAKAIIITAKHHDGFCLWPTKYSTHTIRESGWKNGKGDILKDLSIACKKAGLKFGVYLSPWDRNHPDYGTEKYNDVYVSMMKEIFANYGPIWELWWDGANGEGPNGKRQEYDWARFRQTVKSLSPNTVVFSDVGPHIRWVGNENGIVGSTNWNLLDTIGYTAGPGAPKTDTLNKGNINGKAWVPGECDVSIRPGWFYHKEEDSKVKTGKELFNLYLKSVGRGANLLLNVPPDRNGLFTKYDEEALLEFKKLRTAAFGKPIVSKAFLIKPNLLPSDYSVKLPKATAVNCVSIKEAIQYGQKVIAFTVKLYKNKELVKEVSATTIGRKRILTFDAVEADAIKIDVTESKAKALISAIQVYLIPEDLVEK